jgi:hypothetical protein
VNLSDARETIERVHSWANTLHAGCECEDRINPDMRPNKVERQQIAEYCMGVMKSCTQVLDDLDAIEEAFDEIDAAGRSNFKRERQGGKP